MKIRNFTFRNLCSYGNKPQSFAFSEDPQLILVEGKNGGGKSTISDAMTFAIYGKSSIRKTTELPNRFNKNGYTYIDFLTDSEDVVAIERGLQPNFSRLEINGLDHNLPDKRRIDEFIEDELVKIPFNIFSNTISLSINEFKSFVTLSPNDKRQIIDKIFGIEIVNDMAKKNKEELKNLRLALHTLDISIDSNTITLNNSLTQLANMKEDLSAMKDARKKELAERIEQLQKDKDLYQKNYNEMNAAIASLDKAVNSAKEARTSAQFLIADWQKKLQIYESNKCPHCLSDLTDTGHTKIKDEIVRKKIEQEKALPTIAKRVQEAETTLSEKKGELEFARNQFYKVEALLLPLRRELSSLSIDEIQTEGSEYITQVIESIRKTLSAAELEKTKISEQISVSQEMEDILSENGMKRLLMRQIVPILNKKILRTSKILDFPFAFEFDMDFDPIITHLGIQISPGSLSTGERKKMNLIVLLGIVELIKLKHHNVNLLFLDEIFSSLDSESTYRVVDLLKTFSKKYRMTIFVISNDPLPEELFDRKFSVKKVDQFSDIEFS